jgi:hypothetical protein
LNRDLTNRRILSLALEALKAEREKINAEILSIQSRLGKNATPTRAAGMSSSRISAAGRKAISDAMKKRWARHRAAKALRNR